MPLHPITPGTVYTEHVVTTWSTSLKLLASRNIWRTLHQTPDRQQLSSKRVVRWALRRLKKARTAGPVVGFIPVSDIDIRIVDDPWRPFGARLLFELRIIDDPDGTLKTRFGGRLRAKGEDKTILIAHETAVN